MKKIKKKTKVDKNILVMQTRSVWSCWAKPKILLKRVLVKINEETTVKIILVKTKATQVMKIESITIVDETIVVMQMTSVQTSSLK